MCNYFGLNENGILIFDNSLIIVCYYAAFNWLKILVKIGYIVVVFHQLFKTTSDNKSKLNELRLFLYKLGLQYGFIHSVYLI